MPIDSGLEKYAPQFLGETFSERDLYYLEPFASNPKGLISALSNLPPEIVGALCSRASRAKNSLLRVLLDEYIYPIVDGEDKTLAQELEETVKFLRGHGFKNILNNPARPSLLRQMALAIRRRLDRPDDRHPRGFLGHLAGGDEIFRRPPHRA